jgi:hypothetical protein
MMPLVDREVVVLVRSERRTDAERRWRHSQTNAARDHGRGGPARERSLFARLWSAIAGWWSPGVSAADPPRQPTVVSRRRLTPSGAGSKR